MSKHNLSFWYEATRIINFFVLQSFIKYTRKCLWNISVKLQKIGQKRLPKRNHFFRKVGKRKHSVDCCIGILSGWPSVSHSHYDWQSIPSARMLQGATAGSKTRLTTNGIGWTTGSHAAAARSCVPSAIRQETNERNSDLSEQLQSHRSNSRRAL